MEVCEGETSTGSRNPSPSLPEGASTSTSEETPMELGPSALPNGKATSEPSTSSSCSSENREPSGSACDEVGSSGDCEKAENNDSVDEDERSESSDSVNGGEVVLTDAMLKEEQRLHDAESRENSTEREKVTELRGMVEHQRYLRLQHLLERSTIYSRFLLKQMEDQKDKEQKEEEKRQKKNTNKPTKEKSDEGQTEGRLTRSGASLKSPEVRDQPPPGRGKKRGRKRKAEESSFKISDFVDSQGQLKKRKLENGEAGGGTAKAPQGDSKEKQQQTSSGITSGGGGKRKKARKEAAEEIAEQRYFRGQLIPAQQPKLFTGGVMRSYQIDGMEWIKALYENGVNGILGDEMGLGKTIQCIAVIAHMIEMGVKGPFLVAAPLSTVPNWVSEFKKFTPTIPVVLYHGTQDERLHLRRSIFRGASSNKKKRKGSGVGQQSGEVVLPVVVTSYEICMRDQQYLMNRNWKFLVVDEGHRIKNLNCKLIKALKSYDAANRLLLTGTPLQNNLAELWSLLNFLLPDIFDDLNSFQSWFDFDTSGDDYAKERIIAQEREQNVLKTLHQILTPFLLRRLKTDVEFSLPPKKEVLVYAPLTPYQEKYYKSLLNNTIFEMMAKEEKKKLTEMKKKGKENLGSSGEGGGAEGEGEMECDEGMEERRVSRQRKVKAHYSQLSDSQFEQILRGEADLEEFVPTKKEEKDKQVVLSVKDIKMTSVFTMLRKCCNHPYLLEFPLTPDGDFLIDEQIVTSCGKVLLLDRMLPALIHKGHKTLIFSQFTSMLDILEDYLEMRGLVCSRLDGTMAFAERERQMTMFRESPDCHIFLLSTRAGGLGINLTNADTVIIYDSDWNPQCDLQAQDRCHRIGQTKPVMVYRFVTANTIDQRIVERAASKRRLEKMVIHKGKFKGKANEIDLSLDDLVELLHSVDHHKVVDSRDAVISDEQLEALLDRTLTSQEKKTKNESSSAKSNRPSASGDQNLFRVIEERDAKGNITREGDNSVPTTDTWHIVGDNDGDLNSEGGKREDTTMAGTSGGQPIVDSDSRDGVAEMDTVSGDDRNQIMLSTDAQDHIESNGVKGDHEESNIKDCAGQGKPSTHTFESSNDANLGENTQTDENLPTTIGGNVFSSLEPLPNSNKVETAKEDLVHADAELCGSIETPVIEADCTNDVGGLDTQPDATCSPERNVTTAKSPSVCMEGQPASNPAETMTNDYSGHANLESINEVEKSNAIPITLVMNEA